MARNCTLEGPLGRLAEILGGTEALCQALGGTDPSTVWRWSHGKSKPAPAAARLVFDLCEANHILPPEWAKFRRAPVVKTWIYEELTRTAESRIKRILEVMPADGDYYFRKSRYDVAFGVYLAWDGMTLGFQRAGDGERLLAMTQMPQED